MMNQDKKYNEIISGEISVIYEELDSMCNASCSTGIGALPVIENIKVHLSSIEQKISKSSIDYINICTYIVDGISNRVISYVDNSSDSFVDNLSAQDTVKFYAHQRENLVEALEICRRLDTLNMDYAYRIKNFKFTKEKVENICHAKGIDTRSLTQKSIDQLKSVGEVTGAVAVESAGCLASLAIKIAIIVVIFIILMAIFGVKG